MKLAYLPGRLSFAILPGPYPFGIASVLGYGIDQNVGALQTYVNKSITVSMRVPEGFNFASLIF